MLAEALRRQLEAPDGFKKAVLLLHQYRAAGGNQQEAIRTLERLRLTGAPPDEDHVLELLDLVTGFCAPQHAIW